MSKYLCILLLTLNLSLTMTACAPSEGADNLVRFLRRTGYKIQNQIDANMEKGNFIEDILDYK